MSDKIFTGREIEAGNDAFRVSIDISDNSVNKNSTSKEIEAGNEGRNDFINGIKRTIEPMADSIEPLEYFILYKEELLSRLDIKRIISDEYRRTNTILMYLAFSISFLVLYFFYRSQYTLSQSIFPLNEIEEEDGWSNCKPITTLVGYAIQLTSGIYYYSNKSTDNNIFLLTLGSPTSVYFNSFETCMNQLNRPQQICDPSNICLSNQNSGQNGQNGVISLCNGEILPNIDCSQSCARNYVQIDFLGQTSSGPNNELATVNDFSYFCNQNYNVTVINYACQQIYASENPYNCSKKNYNNFITSVSLAFSSSLLLFQILLRISLLIMKRIYKNNK